MLCVCHTTPAQNGSICSLFSGWATTTGRLLRPKIALGVFLKGTRRATASGVEPGFRNLLINSLALSQLRCAAAVICYYLSNHSKVDASH